MSNLSLEAIRSRNNFKVRGSKNQLALIGRMPFCVSTPLSLQNPLLSLVNEKPKSAVRVNPAEMIKSRISKRESGSIRFLLCANVLFVMSIQTYFGNDADDDDDDEEKDIIAEGMSGSIRYLLRSHVLTREVSPAISFSDR